VDQLAKGLLSLGLKKGDRLGVWSPNTHECYLAQLAGWKAGLIVVIKSSIKEFLSIQ
jgi:acyl-CoA synthetase (AMP-forming)/AMP-acid ligase II